MICKYTHMICNMIIYYNCNKNKNAMGINSYKSD